MRKHAPALAQIAVTGLAYYIAGRLSVLLASPDSYAALVWPAAGIALAAVLVWGRHTAIGVYIGSVGVIYSLDSAIWREELSTFSHLAVPLICALGAALQALFAAFLIRRFTKYDQMFASESFILGLLILGGPVGCLTSSTIGTLTQTLVGDVDIGNAHLFWLSWWVGDSVGTTLFAPVFLLYDQYRKGRLSLRRFTTVCIPILVIFCLTAMAFWESSRRDAIARDARLHKYSNEALEYVREQVYLLGKKAPDVSIYTLLATAASTLEKRGLGITAHKDLIPLLDGSPLNSPWKVTYDLRIGSEEWYVTIYKQHPDSVTYSIPPSLIPLTGGLFFGALIAAFFLLMLARSEKTDQALLAKSQELAATNRFLDSILDNIPASIFVKHAKTRKFVLLSKHTEQMTGRKNSDLLGKTDHDFFPKEEADVFVQGDNEALENNELVVTERERITAKNGDPLFLRTKKIPICSDNNKPEYLLGISEDITEKVRTEEALKAAKEAAEAAAEAKSNFLANMSHEIRTPMNGVLGMTELLLSTDIGTEQRNLAEAIEECGKSLLHIIDGVLDFSKVEADSLLLEHKPFDLKECIRGCANVFELRCKAQNIKFTVEHANDTPLHIVGDEFRIRQILMNLLSNALKFTHQGEIGLSVQPLPLNDSQIDIQIEVFDSGVGIPRNKQKEIFDPFTQADESTTRLYGGTGLGLAVCKALVKAMSGDIKCQSTEGVGTIISFNFIADIFRAKESQEYGKEQAFEIPSVDLFDLSVLVAEDNIVNQVVVTRQLQTLGINPVVVSNGQDAVDQMKEMDFDVILMDCQMPVLDGYEATRIIRKNFPEDKQPYIVAITAHALDGDDFKCIRAGMDAYLSKPVRVVELRSKISEVQRSKNQTPSLATTEAVDLSQINDAFGGNYDLLKKTLDVYRRRYPEQLNAMRSAVTKADGATLLQVTNQIKGSSSYFCSSELSAHLRQLESAAMLNRFEGASHHVDCADLIITSIISTLETNQEFFNRSSPESLS